MSDCIDSMADLKALNAGASDCVRLLGYHAPGDGGGGLFFWDPTSGEPDNAGTVIMPAANLIRWVAAEGGGGQGLALAGRWKRVIEGPLSVKWFGAKGDGQSAALDGPAIQAALDAVPPDGGTVVFPPGHYMSYQGFIVKAKGTTITGLRSAYSYSGGPVFTTVQFLKFQFLAPDHKTETGILLGAPSSGFSNLRSEYNRR
jgi:hypothetical protein